MKRQVAGFNLPWLDQMASHRQDPFRVLVACILSLRTQDRTTAGASERLFSIAGTPEEMMRLPLGQIEKAIFPVGFYRVKARTIRGLSRELAERCNSVVPDEIDDLLRLKGVGRKTANLVVTAGYGKPGICVDTHVHRITNRWGFVKTKDPAETEQALRKKLPRRYWIGINGLLVAFGQNICKPISPLCSRCSINSYCEKRNVPKHR